MTSSAIHTQLDPLLGDWNVEGSSQYAPEPVRGSVSFAWLHGGPFLVQRWTIDHRVFPDGIAIIGEDAASGSLRQHYYDSRGIARVYEMSLGDGVWKLWRNDPDFSQRFAGAFSDDGATIRASWEKSDDGSRWQHDFDLIYTLVAASGLKAGGVATRLPAQDLERARAFYAEKLGLEPSDERPGGLLYRCAHGEFALFASAGAPSGSHTQMGWEVEDIEATVAELKARGVVFEEYDFPGLKTVDGIADIAGNYPSKGGAGERGAWFRDSEGNLVGIGQPLSYPPARVVRATAPK